MRLWSRIAIAAAFLLAVGGAALGGLYVGRGQGSAGSEARLEQSPALRRPPDTDQQIADLQARIARMPANARAHTSLGALYLQKARESGDPAYYTRAEAAYTKANELDPNDADNLVGLGTLALARHRFDDALIFGYRARTLNPYKAAALGVIGDAQVELGRYEEAADTFQAMVDLRPDLASYARVSYIRELNGDMPGAIEMMQKAVDTGAPGTEAFAWTRVQLGHLHFNNGNLSLAEREYEHTLFELPNYLHARAGLARIRAARGDYELAVSLYEQITKQMPLPEYVIALADVYHAAGKEIEAKETEALVQVMDKLYRDNGVNTDVEMALFSADHDLDLPGTVERARRALSIRPGIHGHDALAWALYKNGQYEEAMAASDRALRLGTRDALMRYHAGMIALKLGQPDRARAFLREAITQNPSFSLLYADEARQTLALLERPAIPRTAAGR